MNTYRNSSFSRTKVLALAALLAGCSVATAKPSINIGARVFLDDVLFSGSDYDKNGGTYYNAGDQQSLNGSKFPSGANLREANIWLYGELANDFDYHLQIDMLGRTPKRYHWASHDTGRLSSTATDHYSFSTLTRVRVEQAWMRYSYGDFQLKFGQMYVPMGMAHTTDKSHQLFMEKPNLVNLLERRHFGVQLFTSGDMWTISGAVVQKEFHQGAVAGGAAQENNTYSTNSEEMLRNDTYAGIARITCAPCNDKDKTLHFGFNAKYKELHGKAHDGSTVGTEVGGVAYHRHPVKWVASTELISRQSSPYILSTHTASSGFYHPVKHFHVLGVEVAGKWEAFHAQFEMMHLKADYDDADNKDFKGIYVQGGWIWTGESRPYNLKKGVFENPIPDGKCGAWELAARFSHINLDHEEGTIGGGAVGPDDQNARQAIQDTGKASTYSLGINWYVNQSVCFKGNYSVTKFNFRTSRDRDIKGFGLRAQLDL